MKTTSKNITIEQLLNSLKDNFDSLERERILLLLKESNPTDDALLGAKLLLEDNNWDYKVLKVAFEKTNNRLDQLVPTKKNSNWDFLKYAAVFVPIIGMVAFFMVKTTSSIDDYYIKEEGLPHVMSEVTNPQWDNLMQLYTSGKTKTAFVFSEKILDIKPENDTAQYYHAVIAYDLKKYAVAQKYFEAVAQNPQSVFYTEAEFRLGFVLFKSDKQDASKQQFNTVKNNLNNPYQEEAAEILTKVF